FCLRLRLMRAQRREPCRCRDGSNTIVERCSQQRDLRTESVSLQVDARRVELTFTLYDAIDHRPRIGHHFPEQRPFGMSVVETEWRFGTRAKTDLIECNDAE